MLPILDQVLKLVCHTSTRDKQHMILGPSNMFTLRLLSLLYPCYKRHVPACATLIVTWKPLDLEGSAVFLAAFSQEIYQRRTRTNDETSFLLSLFRREMLTRYGGKGPRVPPGSKVEQAPAPSTTMSSLRIVSWRETLKYCWTCGRPWLQSPLYWLIL